jgi:hypothetical protein
MKDDDDFFDLQRELFLERQKNFGHREDQPAEGVNPVRYVPVDTGEECVGG